MKWPNDVLVLRAGTEEIDGWGTDRKVAGILAEALPAAHPEAEPAVIIGIGVNVGQTEEELPVPWATSLHLTAQRAGAAARPTVHDVLLACGRHLAALVARWEEFDGDAHAAGLAEQVRGACVTLGRRVRAELPGRAGGHRRGGRARPRRPPRGAHARRRADHRARRRRAAHAHRRGVTAERNPRDREPLRVASR